MKTTCGDHPVQYTYFFYFIFFAHVGKYVSVLQPSPAAAAAATAAVYIKQRHTPICTRFIDDDDLNV